MPYDPNPTIRRDLPAELTELGEALAERVHDAWARGRLDEGWTYGPSRSDTDKLHPCLVPYRDLPESEKEFDRRSVAATIATILELGYRITKG
jgi:hypothetical protein